MPRSLNIERRRKRIRHYHARRRQRSSMHRAFSYWWSTIALLIFVAIALTATTLNLFPRLMKMPANFTRPTPSIRLVTLSQMAYKEYFNAGQMVPTAERLTDEDMGIAFEQKLPEPHSLSHGPLSPFPHLEPKIDFSPLKDILPPISPKQMWKAPEKNVFHTQLALSLRYARYQPSFENIPLTEAGEAQFYIVLNAQGKPMEVMRFAPIGVETPTLTALRRTLLKTHGKRAAEGLIHIYWKKGAEE